MKKKIIFYLTSAALLCIINIYFLYTSISIENSKVEMDELSDEEFEQLELQSNSTKNDEFQKCVCNILDYEDYFKITKIELERNSDSFGSTIKDELKSTHPNLPVDLLTNERYRCSTLPRIDK